MKGHLGAKKYLFKEGLSEINSNSLKEDCLPRKKIHVVKKSKTKPVQQNAKKKPRPPKYTKEDPQEKGDQTAVQSSFSEGKIVDKLRYLR